MSGSVFVPADREELLSWLQAGWAEGRRFWIAGQGDPHPDPTAVQLDLSRFQKILFFDPDDLVVGVEVGALWQTLQQTLAAEGMGVPVNPWYDDDCVGTVVAKNRFGPERLYRGGVRDWVIGMTYATVDGRLIEVGGRVVKNVTGYDLGRFMVGNRGELAVLLSVNFKCMPLPQQPEAWVHSCRGVAWAAAAEALVRQHVPVDWVQVREQAGTFQLGVGFSGGEARRKSVAALLQSALSGGRRPIEASPAEAVFTRLSAGPALVEQPRDGAFHAHGRFTTSALLRVAGDLAALDCRQVIHPMGADVHLWFDDPTVVTALHQLAAKTNAFWVMEATEADLQRCIPKPPESTVYQKLKQSFDSKGCLSARFHGDA